MTRKRLSITILAALVVAGAIIASIVSRSDGARRGRGSVEEVVRGSLAALSAGDVDQLVMLADPVSMFELAVTCDTRDDKVDDEDRDREALDEHARQVAGSDPQAILARMRADFVPIVDAAKGLRIELVAIKSNETSDIARGAPMMAGCRAKRPLRFVRQRVALRVAEPGAAPHDQEVVFSIAEVDGRYFLSVPPLLRSR